MSCHSILSISNCLFFPHSLLLFSLLFLSILSHASHHITLPVFLLLPSVLRICFRSLFFLALLHFSFTQHIIDWLRGSPGFLPHPISSHLSILLFPFSSLLQSPHLYSLLSSPFFGFPLYFITSILFISSPLLFPLLFFPTLLSRLSSFYIFSVTFTISLFCSFICSTLLFPFSFFPCLFAFSLLSFPLL